MPINPITGFPYGSEADRRALQEIPEAPWWATLAGLLFVPFFWAIFYVAKGLLGSLLTVLGAVTIPHSTYASVGAGILVAATGGVLYRLRARRQALVGWLEVVLGVAAGTYLLLSLPEGGASVMAGLPGTVFGVADGIQRIAEIRRMPDPRLQRSAVASDATVADEGEAERANGGRSSSGR